MRKAIASFFHRAGDIMAFGYDAADSMRYRRDLGWGRSVPRDEDSLVSDGTLERLRLKGADLRRNGHIAGMCERIAKFTVGDGLRPQAMSGDPKWDRLAEDYFIQWAKVCDVRGRCSLWEFQRMAASLRPTHGGLFFEIVENGQIRPIEGERIRQPQKADEAKAYIDGVKVDRSTGRILGYKVHARDDHGGFSGKHEERFVPAENMFAVTRAPWRPDQVREIPDLAPVIPILQDVQEMNTYQLNTAKVQSQIVGFLKKHGGGGANTWGPRGTTAAVGQRQTFKTEAGMFFEGFPGEDVDLKVNQSPGGNHIPYMKFELLLAAAALDFPYEFFTLDFSSADFSRMKAVLLMVNQTIGLSWQPWLNEKMNQRLWNWRIAKAMKEADLPQAPVINGVSQWFRVEWQAPEEPWVDRQEAQQADVLEIQSNLGTYTGAIRRRGGDPETNLRQNARFLKLIETVAEEEGVDPAKLHKMQIPGQTDAGAAPRKSEDRGQGTAQAGKPEEDIDE